jgi:hypothetical protein
MVRACSLRSIVDASVLAAASTRRQSDLFAMPARAGYCQAKRVWASAAIARPKKVWTSVVHCEAKKGLDKCRHCEAKKVWKSVVIARPQAVAIHDFMRWRK